MEAVQKVEKDGLSGYEVARCISLPKSTIENWVRALRNGKRGEIGKNIRPLTEQDASHEILIPLLPRRAGGDFPVEKNRESIRVFPGLDLRGPGSRSRQVVMEEERPTVGSFRDLVPQIPDIVDPVQLAVGKILPIR